MRGLGIDLIIIDDTDLEVVMSAEETWAWEQAEKIEDYGADMAEPVHPFVKHEIYKAILGARRRGRRDARSR